MNIIWSLLFLIPVTSSATEKKVAYGSPVELVGTLDLQTFPGPPGYESIQNGDDVERHFYLKLDLALAVLPDPKIKDIQDAAEEKNVKIIQLSIGEDEKLWAKFRKAGIGAHVAITGNLFHRFTGHHHSRVLMTVQNIKLHEISSR
jgi:hypothetical protein